MARLNLLPWREALREEQRKGFLRALAAVLAVAVGVIVLGAHSLGDAIERQVVRNAYLSQQGTVLDERIRQINDLKARRQQLLERVRVIQALQGNRSINGRILDQLARMLPHGVYFTEVKLVGATLSIVGVAESNARVADLLRNLEGAEGLEAPGLSRIKASAVGAMEQARVFRLTLRQARLAAAQGAG